MFFPNCVTNPKWSRFVVWYLRIHCSLSQDVVALPWYVIYITFIRNCLWFMSLYRLTFQNLLIRWRTNRFNIQQLYALPTRYLYVLYLSENKQRLLPPTWFVPKVSVLIFLCTNWQRGTSLMYRVIRKSLRDFRTRLRNNQDRHDRKKHINR